MPVILSDSYTFTNFLGKDYSLSDHDAYHYNKWMDIVREMTGESFIDGMFRITVEYVDQNTIPFLVRFEQMA